MHRSAFGANCFRVALIVFYSVLMVALLLVGCYQQPDSTTVPTTQPGTSVTTGSTPQGTTTLPTTEPTTLPTTTVTQVPTTEPTEPTTQPTEPTTKPTEPTTKPTEPIVPDLSVFKTENVTRVTFYGYYGNGTASDVPAENMAEILQWLDSFAIGEKADDILPPGTNTHLVEIVYADGTVVKNGLSTISIDGTVYYMTSAAQPDCFAAIIAKSVLPEEEDPTEPTKPTEPPHEHTFGTEWQADSANHWNECACGERANSGAHADTDWNKACDVCNMFMPHRHSYGDEWVYDENNHWNACVCGDKSSIAAHIDANFDERCDVCTMNVTHNHSFGTEWKSDDKNHWHVCACGEKADDAAHTDGDFDEKCDVCTAHVPHTHSFGIEWKSDENNHWNACVCGEKNNTAAHTDADFNEKCDVCDAHVPHSHSFGAEWQSDDENHWNVCACGEKGNSAAHIDLNTDSKCDTCTASMGEPFDVAKFFSETVFLGDSVTMGLRNYCMLYPDALHGAKFLCAGSYAVRHAIGEVGGEYIISITYQGQKMRPEDALAAMGAKRVFIMLGLNDIGIDVDWTLQNWAILLKNLRKKCPDMEIYIQSGTPILIGGEVGGVNNKNMNRYNTLLEQFCKDNNVNFVNVAEALKDDQGGLKAEYCSDNYCHMTYAGVRVWIDYLKNYVINKHK